MRGAVALLLVGVTLAPSVAGRAGFQTLERATAERIFPLHQHGIPGEAEYIHAHHAPAPFVPPHCHEPIEADQPATPAQMAMGGLLFGPSLCGPTAYLPPAPPAFMIVVDQAVTHGDAFDVRPSVPPPRA